MIIQNIKNPKDFFKQLEKCKGSIELITTDGDRLNLKSKLSQYIILTDVFSNITMKDLEILFSEPEDTIHIIDYLIRK